MFTKIIEPPAPFRLDLAPDADIQDFYPEEGGRWYSTPAGNFPSVTTVLGTKSKEGITAWIERVGEKEANKIKNQAAHKGQGLHDLCEEYVLNSKVDIFRTPPTVKHLFKQIHPLLDEHLGLVRGIEIGLYSEFLFTAGRSDLVGEWDGVLSVIDYKNSRKRKSVQYLENYFWQATCYAMMLRERHDIICEQLVLLIGVNGSNTPQVVKRKISDFEETVRDFYTAAKDGRLTIEPPPFEPDLTDD